MSQNSWIITDDEIANLWEKGGDQLGSTRYVEELFSIITSLTNKELDKDKGFNIGLYGGWGSGKSSITRSLVEKLKKEKEKEFIVIDFDVWKYSKDDLRRSILFELAKKSKNEKIIKKLYQSSYQNTGTEEARSGQDWDRIKQYLKKYWWLVIPFIISGVMWFSVKKYFPDERFTSCIEIIGGAGFITIVLSKIRETIVTGSIRDKILEAVNRNNLGAIADFMPKVTVSHSISENNIFSGEQFESRFSALIGQSPIIELSVFSEMSDDFSKIKKDYDKKKILFIFDNIDRCDGDTVREILMTIKTFLDKEHCIFLLPIDYESVCKHYHTEYSQGDEYLRKIFNLGIHIKTHQYDKLHTLVEKVINQNHREEQLGVTDEETQEISYILASVFANNPRKIKQFLNKLGAEHIGHNKEKNILALLKLLVIQQEIPKLYKYLSNNLAYIDKIITYLENFGGDYEKFINHKRDGFTYIKNIPEITEREMILLYELSAIQEYLPFLDGEKSILRYLISDPKQFIGITKEKKLQHIAKQIIEENISLVRKSITHAKDIFNLYLYYTVEYGIDQKMFLHIFKKNSIFFDIFEGELAVSGEILYQFINSINEDEIKKLGFKFKSWFMSHLFLENSYVEYIDYFGKIKTPKQNLLIDTEKLIIYFDDSKYINFMDEYIDKYIVFDFLKRYPNFINNTIIKNLLSSLPQSIGNIGSVDIFNKIRLIGFKKIIDKNVGEQIFNIAKESFNISYVQSYTNPTYKLITDTYLECARMLLLSLPERNQTTIDNLANIYNNGNEDTQKKVISIFRDDFKRRKPYKWPYADFIINNNIEKNFIKDLIEKTSYQNGNRKGLSDVQIRIIVQNLGRNNGDKELIVELWKRAGTKNIVIGSIMTDNLEDVNKKIEYLKERGVKISEKDRGNIGKDISDRVIKLINTRAVEDLGSVCDFLIAHSEILKNLNKSIIKKAIEDYPAEELDISINFENKRKEVLNML